MRRTTNLSEFLKVFNIAPAVDIASALCIISEQKKGLFWLPVDTGKRIGLSEMLVSRTKAASGIAILQTGVRPSCEVKGLYDRIRKSERIAESILDAKCDIVEGDNEYLTCLFAAAICNFWDFLFVSSSPRMVVFFSHDEYVALAEAEDYRGLREILASEMEQM